ncbi:MAG: hypothetical protein GY796_12700, partial [Chloroflexi bacterium]|nr:hypothetical protein [Chloroflexota bacterium]
MKKILLAVLVFLFILIMIPIGILLLPPPPIEYAQPSDTAVSNPSPTTTLCNTNQQENSLPCNTSLADSAWSVSHGSSYAQGSSDFPGLESADDATAQHLDLGGIPITLNFTTPYADGGTAVWG